MSLAAWLSLAAICAMGAVSPGPSLAVVVRNTIAGGRAAGIQTAVAHGAGIGLYALMVALGLAVIVAESDAVFRAVQLAGAGFLAYLGIRALTSGGTAATASEDGGSLKRRVRGARDGFFIAFLNPKIAIWFLALFSQFVRPDAPTTEKLLMAATAAAIDTVWYTAVAVSLSHSRVLEWLRRKAVWIDRVFGVILIAVAVRVFLI